MMGALDISDPHVARQLLLLVSVFVLVFSIWCIILVMMALRRRARDEAVRP